MKITHLLIGGIDSTRNELLSELVILLSARNPAALLRIVSHQPSDLSTMCRSIEEVYFEMEKRLRTLRLRSHPILALALYDIHRLRENKLYAVFRKLEAIAAKGRSANIHLLCSTHSSKLKKIPRAIINVSTRIAFLTAHIDDSICLIDSPLAYELQNRETFLIYSPSPSETLIAARLPPLCREIKQHCYSNRFMICR